MFRIVTKQDVTKALFVIKAVATDKFAGIKRYVVLQEDRTLAATDGHRAHSAQIETDAPAGIYEIVKKSKTEAVFAKVNDQEVNDFPDWKRCVPSIEGVESIHIPLGRPAYYSYTELIRRMQPGFTLNIDYFNDAATLSNIYVTADALQPIVFTGDGAQAIVMPVKIP